MKFLRRRQRSAHARAALWILLLASLALVFPRLACGAGRSHRLDSWHGA